MDVEDRVAALAFLMISVLSSAGIDETAEELVRSTVDVVRPRVVGPQCDSVEGALIEVHRSGMIDALRVGGETGDGAQETLALERADAGDCVEGCQRWSI